MKIGRTRYPVNPSHIWRPNVYAFSICARHKSAVAIFFSPWMNSVFTQVLREAYTYALSYSTKFIAKKKNKWQPLVTTSFPHIASCHFFWMFMWYLTSQMFPKSSAQLIHSNPFNRITLLKNSSLFILHPFLKQRRECFDKFQNLYVIRIKWQFPLVISLKINNAPETGNIMAECCYSE